MSVTDSLLQWSMFITIWYSVDVADCADAAHELSNAYGFSPIRLMQPMGSPKLMGRRLRG